MKFFSILRAEKPSFGFCLDFSLHSKLENLSLLETMTDVRVGYRAVSFVNLPSLLKIAINPAYRERLQQRILLPATPGVAKIIRMLTGRDACAAMPSQDFVPVLLSFMAQPRRIVLAGTDRTRLSAARDHIRAQVPWHQVYATHLPSAKAADQTDRLRAEIGGVRPHLVLLDCASVREEMFIEPALASAYDGLALIAPAYFAGAPTVFSASERGDDGLLTICSPNKFSLS